VSANALVAAAVFLLTYLALGLGALPPAAGHGRGAAARARACSDRCSARRSP